jgi:endonuclease III
VTSPSPKKNSTDSTLQVPTYTGAEIVKALDTIYPKVKTALTYSNPFELLVATVLSAQCTDAAVNNVTPVLFKRFPNAKSLARANVRTLETIVKSTGFYHVKARRIKALSRILIATYGGEVPKTMSELVALPGIGRKTANIVLSAGYDLIEGVAVDTHVFRVSRRIGLTESNTPEKIELDLMKITPEKELWPRLSMLLIFHGRRTCVARRPLCERCVLRRRCLYFRTMDSGGIPKPSS